MRPARVVAGLVLAAALGLGVWAFALEPASLAIRNHRLSIPGWHADLAGLRVAVLADLHVGSPFHLFVSPGLGTSILPVRFRVPPEITLLELYP